MVNHALLNLIPRSAQSVLDVGCAAGDLGQALKERQPCQVTGVEIDPQAAEQARANLDYIICGDIADVVHELAGSSYDCIVLGDVLEHLPDPDAVLRDLRPLLADGGRLVLSVPNVRHWSVLGGLIEGRWDYTDKGLLDRTHCHLFTRDSLMRALHEAGFAPTVVDITILEDVQAPPAVVSALAEVGDLDVSTLFDEARVYQWLVSAQVDDTPEPLTSIIIVAHNLWDQTWACLQSIAAYTPEHCEVIVVDNGSTDETPQRLQELLPHWSNLRVITNAGNCSFAEANNQGIEISKGDTVLLLNNDTVVTQNWLGRMLGVFEAYPQVGIVGPVSNYVAGFQRIPVDYTGPDEMQAFAAEWAREHAGEVQQVAGVIGFCFCIRRALIDEIGHLDERFVNGYEETDYCTRAIQAGYDILIARDVFVHHTGSQTFREQGATPEERDSRYWTSIEENWQRFKEKWAIPADMSANEGLGWLLRQVAPASGRPRVFWALLFERALLFEATDRFLDIAAACARAGCERIVVPYTATDNARNHIERKFLAQSRHPDDVLVMLDADHQHPTDIVLHLAGYPHEVGVVGALAFRRAEPHDPQFYVQDESGALQQPADIDELSGCLAEGDLVGAGAIAIKRWVFDQLTENGYRWPHWRVQYPENALNRPGEEIYFAECCQKIGIKHYCAIDAETPHLATTLIGRRTWKTYRQKHPEIVRDLEEVEL